MHNNYISVVLIAKFKKNNNLLIKKNNRMMSVEVQFQSKC